MVNPMENDSSLMVSRAVKISFVFYGNMFHLISSSHSDFWNICMY